MWTPNLNLSDDMVDLLFFTALTFVVLGLVGLLAMWLWPGGEGDE